MLKRAVDLVSCDNEPIHIIGAVQPHGVLVALDQQTFDIHYASANAISFFGHEAASLIGRPAEALLGPSNVGQLRSRTLETRLPELLIPWFLRIDRPDGDAVDLECYAHRHEGRIVLEFVLPQEGPAAVWEEDLLRQTIISELIKPDSLSDLAEAGARIIREVTGFDRVMIYRFAPDKHGEVIAESTVRHDSFLGLHYPASDIPDPARRHFVLNVIRTIPDINAVPVPILMHSGAVADAESAAPLDLTFSKLRAVAPVHVEYLNNMGVGASMSISLVADKELWGLVACHHYGPLHISWSRLRFCELLGATISTLLQSHANTTKLKQSIGAEKLAFEIERQARRGKLLVDAVRDHADALLKQCGASGMVLRLDGHRLSLGAVPDPMPDPMGLGIPLADGIAVSDHLASLLPANAPGPPEIAGLALLELSDDGQDYLALFRREFEHTIRWAGKPDKVEKRLDDGTVRLSPRGSFALWREERSGRSKPFTETDLEVLRITRRALFALNSLDRERQAVSAKMQAEAEEARLKLILLDAARNRSMGELAAALAHELNQPLTAVNNYVNACRRELVNFRIDVPEPLVTLMDNAVTESSRAADLVRRLRNFIAQGEISAELIDLQQTIRQGVELALVATRDPRPTVVFAFDPAVEPLFADPVQIGQIVLNLVRNSLSAMSGVSERVLTVSTARRAAMVEVSVRDTGPGIPEAARSSVFEPFHNSTTSGMGIGLTLCRSIVEAHGGRIRLVDTDRGAEVVFTLPIRGVANEPGA